VTLAMRPFRKNFRGSCPNGTWKYASNLKSVALTVLELLAFNAQKFGGQTTLATPPFRKILRGHVRTVPGNMHVKSEVHSFNPFGAISI